MLEIQQETGEAPQALRDRPVLPLDLAYYKRLFHELSDSRPYSQHGQPLPLPISEIAAYFDLFGIKELSERQVLFKALRALDRAFVDVCKEQLEKKLETDRKTNNTVAP